MSTLYATRGLPGSGKSTLARAWVAEDPTSRARVNGDDLRQMLTGGYVKAAEHRAGMVRDSAALSLLRSGVDVVVDNTHLRARALRGLAEVARRAGAEFEVWDLTDVDVEECIRRDAARPEPVGEDVIRGMHQRFLKGRTLPLPAPTLGDLPVVAAPYRPAPGTPRAVLVDVDGTVALMGDRGPYDWGRVGEDAPNRSVIDVAVALHTDGHVLVVMSGRSEVCRDATVAWLSEHLRSPFVGPFMRAEGDHRKDSVVKAELFDAHVRDHYDITAVLDDRRQVVDMWRSMGLVTLQVAEGEF
ncbi:AAA family ATPase [Nocardiopsis sp. CT-R113]|uniref:AAA family ATPase n=1 Tax=Nocardiopsis codii TaxID=3065942 RepID=A0ABU7KDM5_9ACTN|nr:AAA family ATPase [Nocardiopsis sp. CT-R113]MEE2040132.1 AAA family ATPase [Nocardiopsis sp. CT-R113]